MKNKVLKALGVLLLITVLATGVVFAGDPPDSGTYSVGDPTPLGDPPDSGQW